LARIGSRPWFERPWRDADADADVDVDADADVDVDEPMNRSVDQPMPKLARQRELRLGGQDSNLRVTGLTVRCLTSLATPQQEMLNGEC
jgi:hypothetical protein